MCVFTTLLIVFRKHQVYYQNKLPMAVFSIYYKSLIYTVVIFTLCNFPGKDAISIAAMGSIVIYMVLAYINEKQYYQMLNAFLYFNMLAIARLHLFWQIS